MATTISTNGRKKISTLKKEFKEKFPYLELKVYKLEDRGNFELGKSVGLVNNDLTLLEVRTKKGNGEISFSGNKNVGTIETEFFDKLGMYVEIGFRYNERESSGSSGARDKLTLSEFNIYAQEMIAKRREEKE